MEKKNVFKRAAAAVKEAIRKFLVTLKRNPHYIPLVMLLVSFVIISFNLTKISNTTATMNKLGMGLCSFVSILFSILSMVCMLNAFPKRKKPNLPVIILMLLMLAATIAVDALYYSKVVGAVTYDEALAKANPEIILVTAKNFFIIEAADTMIFHIVSVALTALFVLLEPLFARLLKKINTSVNVDDNGEIAGIDISEED